MKCAARSWIRGLVKNPNATTTPIHTPATHPLHRESLPRTSGPPRRRPPPSPPLPPTGAAISPAPPTGAAISPAIPCRPLPHPPSRHLPCPPTPVACTAGPLCPDLFLVKALVAGSYLILSTTARFYAIIRPLRDELGNDSWAWAWTDVKVTSP